MWQRKISDQVRFAENNFANMDYGYNRMNSGYNSMANGGQGSLNMSNTQLFVTVANSNTTTAACSLFNAHQDPTDANIASGVTISVQGSSHVRLKSDIRSNPIFLLSLRYDTTTAAQLNNSWTMRYIENVAGVNRSYPYNPRAKFTGMNYSTTHIDDETFGFLLDGSNSIEFNLAASETVTLAFNIKARAEFSKALEGQNVVSQSSKPVGTGNIMVDRQLMSNYGKPNL